MIYVFQFGKILINMFKLVKLFIRKKNMITHVKITQDVCIFVNLITLDKSICRGNRACIFLI